MGNMKNLFQETDDPFVELQIKNLQKKIEAGEDPEELQAELETLIKDQSHKQARNNLIHLKIIENF
jgi:hypothetical protein